MSSRAEMLKSQIAELSPEDRAELAFFLIHSLDEGEASEPQESIDAAWQSELQQRKLSIENGRDQGEEASQVFEDVRNRFKSS